MIKRGWITATKNLDELENAVLAHFQLSSLSEPFRFPHAARRNYDQSISPLQWAWLFRVNQLATALQVPAYSEIKLRTATSSLEQLMTEPEEIRHVPKILAECGVRFVVVEPIPGSKIDGVCFWIDEAHPVVGLSLKGDQIDKFWFNLWHELEHVLRGDGKSEIVIDDFDEPGDSESELAANAGAADHCVPTKLMANFIIRHTPMFSEKTMLGFSKIVKRHPGVVVGQIQKRTNRWDLFKRYQVRVRHIVIQTALTDGYGRNGI
jgi:HTH-type transcriptional regulator/antitoxin HigA